jgi:capsular polysaccharide export protein
MEGRHFLFLQGPTSPFFSKLGDTLLEHGARVSRINFNGGDWAYWRRKPSWQFRGTDNELPAFLEEKIKHNQITDIIMVGDTRPVSAQALSAAKAYSLRIHIFEEGYFRPGYLTLEEDGINGHSRLPRDPNWYRSVAKSLPPLANHNPVQNPIWLLALNEIGYRLPGLFNPIFYPGYKTHRPHVAAVELTGWAIRFSKMPHYKKRDNSQISTLIATKRPYYILPLQLESDSQIRLHSELESMSVLIRLTLISFAKNAPENSCLVIKNHPLDTGFINFRRLIQRESKALGIKERVVYLESGHLPTLLKHCQGVIVVNSTVGTSALLHGCKTLALSKPIYDLPGLTVQCGLDTFWKTEHSPDSDLLDAFFRVVVHCTQINGGFYSTEGIEIGTRAAAKRLMQDQCPLEALLAVHPPATLHAQVTKAATD